LGLLLGLRWLFLIDVGLRSLFLILDASTLGFGGLDRRLGHFVSG
jgi:hypothetical protein